jgi:hypothetical protein
MVSLHDGEVAAREAAYAVEELGMKRSSSGRIR